MRKSNHVLPPAALGYQFTPGERRDVLLVCDHASNSLPIELGNLGLDPYALRQHIAWDPGAAQVAEHMARMLNCPVFFGSYSRLVVDLNRAPEAPDLILANSDGIQIAGNQGIDEKERQRRLAAYHAPYHQALSRYLDEQARAGIYPVLIAIHSFTPDFAGQQRPWHVGVVWRQPQPWLSALLIALRGMVDVVGDNQPYGADKLGYTLNTHGIGRGLPHAMFEIRQDLLHNAEQHAQWALRLVQALKQARALPVSV